MVVTNVVDVIVVDGVEIVSGKSVLVVVVVVVKVAVKSVEMEIPEVAVMVDVVVVTGSVVVGEGMLKQLQAEETSLGSRPDRDLGFLTVSRSSRLRTERFSSGTVIRVVIVSIIVLVVVVVVSPVVSMRATAAVVSTETASVLMLRFKC